jgi:hypothetical protein
MEGGRSRGLETPWPQFGVFSFSNISTAFFAAVDSPVESVTKWLRSGVGAVETVLRSWPDQSGQTGQVSLVDLVRPGPVQGRLRLDARAKGREEAGLPGAPNLT